jgi:uncharacterized membrane protein
MAQERGPELLTYIIPIGLLIIMVCFLSRLAKQRVLAQSQGRNRIAKHERDKYQKAGLDQEIYHEICLSHMLSMQSWHKCQPDPPTLRYGSLLQLSYTHLLPFALVGGISACQF